jgi:hypothetical protein
VHDAKQADLAAASGANQYSVRPFASASTVTPPMRTAFRAPGAFAAGTPAAATEAPSTASATTDTAAIETPAMSARKRASRRPPTRPRSAGITASPARAAKAATSTTPAAIPAVVRTSLNPNRPIHKDSRLPPSVARENTAPAAAASLAAETSTATPRTKAAMTWNKNSQPMVGIDR